MSAPQDRYFGAINREYTAFFFEMNACASNTQSTCTLAAKLAEKKESNFFNIQKKIYSMDVVLKKKQMGRPEL